MKVSIPIAAIALSLGLASCNAPSPNSPETTAATSEETREETLNIAVSLDPQAYFVEQVGGDHVEVVVMVPPGSSPHTYEPKPEQLRALSDAEAYIQVGVDFEDAWMDRMKSANPQMQVVDSTKGIEKMEMVAHHHHGEHAHGEHAHEEHAHGEKAETEASETDPHVWLAPSLVKTQAQNIRDILVELDGDRQAEYDRNLAEFLQELDTLDAEIRENLAGLENRKFMVFHPSWGYFAREYDLIQIPVEVGGQEPSAAELSDLIREAQAENIRVIFAQPEFSTESAELIAREIDGEVLLISPLARDWADNLREVSQTFAQVLSDNASTTSDVPSQ